MPRKSSLLTLFLTPALLAAAPAGFNDFSLENYQPQNLIINNRILLKIHNKTITLLDVVRKMDLLFFRQYPEYASNHAARYQFYMSGWRSILEAVIDDCLIMKDAEEKEIKVNDGEVREELEVLFGPNVVLNLDQAGMTLDEAFELLKTELIVQRMTSIMVRSKAQAEIHPAILKKKYERMLAENPPQNVFVYKILSVRGSGHQNAAQQLYNRMQEQKIDFDSLAADLQEEGIEISYSQVMKNKEGDLSRSYKSVLETLSAGMTSTPVSTEAVSRIFCLIDIERINPLAFKDVEEKIKRELTQELIARYNIEYRQKLRKNHGLTANYLNALIPEALQPFSLR